MSKKSVFSRRRFLAAGAACAAAPLFFPGRVLGKDGNFAPNDIINVGLVGNGWRKSNIGNRPGSRFIAVADCDTRRIPHDSADMKGFQDYREMLQMP
ncbi:MAG: hypothetical protein E7028_04450, partial [Planctomycetaceae bacterium]|nr:hypothetical protein [Planctomycetaceae bacterium]